MTYFVILILIVLVITSANDVYGLWVPETPDELLEQSETVFVGTIISVNVLEFERSNTYNVEENGVSRIIVENYTQTLDEYTVNIEEFLKNPQESHTITMLEATVGGVPGRSVSIGGFELGDRVMFYVPKIDGTNQYAPESFKIPKQCDANTVLKKPRIQMGNSFSMVQEGIVKEDNFTANKSVQFIYQRDMRVLDERIFDFQITVRKIMDNKSDEIVLSEKIHAKTNPCEWIASAEAEFTPQIGDYAIWVNITEDTGTDTFSGSFSVENHTIKEKIIISPLKQINAGIAIEEIQCKDSLVLVTKYDGSPACVKSTTKQHLMDRGWAEQVSFDKIKNNPELMKQNIIRMEDGRISLYPENTCASISLDLPTEKEIQRYKNDERGLNEDNTLQITSSDFNEIPIIEELIYAVNTIEFPYNDFVHVYFDGVDFVEYEFFLADKMIEKYGGTREAYFMKLDEDYEERLTNPKKQGFSNEFNAPWITYNENVYGIGGTIFWTSDEHNLSMSIHLMDAIDEDQKVIPLTDEDMEKIPKIKQAIEDIGTIQESINGRKGLPEDQWNEYREWFKQKSQEQLNTDRFRLMQYDEQFYSVGFGIC